MVDAISPVHSGINLHGRCETYWEIFLRDTIIHTNKVYQSLAPHGNVYAFLICIGNSLLIYSYLGKCLNFSVFSGDQTYVRVSWGCPLVSYLFLEAFSGSDVSFNFNYCIRVVEEIFQIQLFYVFSFQIF